MRITKFEVLQCNAGWRDFSFLKISTDGGLVGWSEYMEGYGAQGLTAIIRKMVDVLNRRNYIRNLVRDVNAVLEE